jgi:CBS domain-containing protein/anti-sigma regulatory factor (Ser/Thr protein kinase)
MLDKAQITKTQELVYEMKVCEVMTPRDKLVTMAIDTPMSELREILRSNHISGVPVLSDEHLVGIISIEDFIKWLAEGSIAKVTVEERMTRSVTTVFADEPLVQAVGRLEEFGYGRLPILNREDNTLAGVVTKGDIIEGLLHKLEIGYEQEQIHSYRASHIFEDIIADQTKLLFQYNVKAKDFTDAGYGASRLKKTLSRLEIHPQVVRRAAIIAYEAEINIVVFTNGGTLMATVEPDWITIEAIDDGPGIVDTKLALTPGYSTAEEWVRELGFGAGMGLHNIQNCADEMTLESVVGKGTHITTKLAVREAK